MQRIEISDCYKQLERAIRAISSDVPRRKPESQDDFGDEATVGLCVKRKGKCIFSGDPNDSFGLFLGIDENQKYIIGINELGSRFSFVAGESFDSLSDLKVHWVLD